MHGCRGEEKVILLVLGLWDAEMRKNYAGLGPSIWPGTQTSNSAQYVLITQQSACVLAVGPGPLL